MSSKKHFPALSFVFAVLLLCGQRTLTGQDTAPPAPLPPALSAPLSPTGHTWLGEAKCEEAREHTRQGEALASRRGFFVARAELFSALRLFAEGQDAASGGSAHREALARAMTAFSEVDDFQDTEFGQPGAGDIAAIVRRHSTIALKNASDAGFFPPRDAIGRYLSYMRQEMISALGGQPGSAETLRTLARLYEVMGQHGLAAPQIATCKSLALYDAALAVDPQNAMAANDLGVLLARCGRDEEAIRALQHSLAIRREPDVIYNLTKLYQRSGHVELAQYVQRTLGAEVPPAKALPSREPVRWVDQATFAQMADETMVNQAVPSQSYAQGDYLDPPRKAHVACYRLRVDDQLDIVYRPDRRVTPRPYRLTVGDEIAVRSASKPNEINSERVLVQPDGMIAVRLLGQVQAAGLTVSELTDTLDRGYQRYFEAPAIAVAPLKINTRVQDLIDAVDRRYGAGGGEARLAVVAPDGTIALPEVGPVPAQGLSTAELEVEINQRYQEKLGGVVVNAVLVQRARRFVYVMGEVGQPGRFELLAPTTLSQAISLGGNWQNGAALRHIIVLRRNENWELVGCVINMQDVLYFNKSNPQNDIWLADSDVVIVPKGVLIKADELIDLVFTRGIYRVLPVGVALNFNKQATL